MNKLDALITEEQFKRLYYDDLYSKEDIARQFNISAWTVHNYMLQHGLKERTMSEAIMAVAKKKYGVDYYYNPELDIRQNQRINIKLRAFRMLGGAKCVNCGCTDIRILEANHKNLDGYKERKGYYQGMASGQILYMNILNGKRKTDDLEVTCKICNALHYVKKKFGIMNYKVIWEQS